MASKPIILVTAFLLQATHTTKIGDYFSDSFTYGCVPYACVGAAKETTSE